MRQKLRRGLERQVVSLERRVRELREESSRAAEKLIEWAGVERRSSQRTYLERQYRRVQTELERLEEEARLENRVPSADEVERHLHGIERQLHDVLAEREEWLRESLRGHRRRAEDLRALDWLREEQERLTTELLRCAQLLRRGGDPDDEPRMRRVWKMLRLSGV
ncbi:MAG: hypothetical protein ACREQ9_22815 [Candidatus Binatia bacterium]